jgi:hypothetical protein
MSMENSKQHRFLASHFGDYNTRLSYICSINRLSRFPSIEAEQSVTDPPHKDLSVGQALATCVDAPHSYIV